MCGESRLVGVGRRCRDVPCGIPRSTARRLASQRQGDASLRPRLAIREARGRRARRVRIAPRTEQQQKRGGHRQAFLRIRSCSLRRRSRDPSSSEDLWACRRHGLWRVSAIHKCICAIQCDSLHFAARNRAARLEQVESFDAAERGQQVDLGSTRTGAGSVAAIAWRERGELDQRPLAVAVECIGDGVEPGERAPLGHHHARVTGSASARPVTASPFDSDARFVDAA